jgi:hypothetical protein
LAGRTVKRTELPTVAKKVSLLDAMWAYLRVGMKVFSKVENLEILMVFEKVHK